MSVMVFVQTVVVAVKVPRIGGLGGIVTLIYGAPQGRRFIYVRALVSNTWPKSV